jgi:formylglycine-generating enzyme
VAVEHGQPQQALALDPPPGEPPFPNMVWVPGGDFAMGSDEFYPEESPVRRETVPGFWMDRAPVTVREFRRFVKATRHVTTAERAPERADYPNADAALLVPGSLVFQGTRGPVSLDDNRAWWRYAPGARWDRPEGPDSDVYTRANHPVTHVAFTDAEAYAAWARKALPTEAEWERAARGGLEGARFAWGDEETAGGRRMANTWQGEFPGTTAPRTAGGARRPSAATRPTASGCSTSRGTCGNGRPSASRARASRRARAAQRPARTPAASPRT